MYIRTMSAKKYLANALTMGNLLSGVLVILGVVIWPFGAPLQGHLQFDAEPFYQFGALSQDCLLYTSPSPRDGLLSRMPSSA